MKYYRHGTLSLLLPSILEPGKCWEKLPSGGLPRSNGNRLPEALLSFAIWPVKQRRYIRGYNKDPRLIQWTHRDVSNRIKPDTIYLLQAAKPRLITTEFVLECTKDTIQSELFAGCQTE